MLRSLRAWAFGLALLAPFAAPAVARADTVKTALFIFGIHTSGVEGVAAHFRSDPTDRHPGAMALIRRNLNWSIELADKMKWDATELKAILRDVDRLSFANIEDRMSALRLAYQAKFAKDINPGAPAYFIIGIQHSGAEGTALFVKDFPRDKKPGSGKLIERNLTWLKEGAPKLALSTALLLKIEADHLKGAPFATTAAELAKVRLAWQDELAKQPGFGGSVAGKLVLNTSGMITKVDPRDRVRKGSFAKVFTVQMHAGRTYRIDLESGDGRSGPHNPGFFDTFLRIEDASGRELAFNDDGGDGLNSRLEFRPPADGMYRVIVTTYRSDATGSFTLKAHEQ